MRAELVARGSEAIVDDDWGIGLLAEPGVTTKSITSERFAVETVSHGAIAGGVYAFSAEVSERRARSALGDLAEAAREELRKQGGVDLSTPVDATFLGHPARAFTFRDADAHGLDVTAVWGRCVFHLLVLRQGAPDSMTEYAGSVLRNLRSLSGGPVEPVVCR